MLEAGRPGPPGGDAAAGNGPEDNQTPATGSFREKMEAQNKQYEEGYEKFVASETKRVLNEIDGAKDEILDNFQRGRKEDNEKHEARHEESIGLLRQIAGSGVDEESAKKIQIARPFGEGDLDLACAPRSLSYSTSEVSLGHSSIAASTGTGTGTRISAPLSEEEREGYKRQIADLELQNRLTRGETRDERVMGSDPKPAGQSKATVRSVQEDIARFQKGRKMRAHQEAGKLQPRR